MGYTLKKNKQTYTKLGGMEGWEVDLGNIRRRSWSVNDQNTLYVCMRFSKYQ